MRFSIDRCNKKRSCGRHKCGQPCCIEEDHPCPLVCGKLLKCGRHRCEDPCHRGPCQSCPHVSFDELFCHCGEQVVLPPVACGVRPPPCANPCARGRLCGHPAAHPCHPDDEPCAPCIVLTDKWCHGKHEVGKDFSHLKIFNSRFFDIPSCPSMKALKERRKRKKIVLRHRASLSHGWLGHSGQYTIMCNLMSHESLLLVMS